MRFAFWINKATNPQTEYVIFIVCPQQQLLGKHTSILRLCEHFLSCNIILPFMSRSSFFNWERKCEVMQLILEQKQLDKNMGVLW
jgi:hypothetical protein